MSLCFERVHRFRASNTGPSISSHEKCLIEKVDRMNLENYVNLTVWVEELNHTIEEVLLERLKEAIAAWTTAFNSEGRPGEMYGHKSRKAPFKKSAEENNKSKLISVETILHELTIRNQTIFLEPPLEHAKAICFSSLHDWLGTLWLLKVLISRGG